MTLVNGKGKNQNQGENKDKNKDCYRLPEKNYEKKRYKLNRKRQEKKFHVSMGLFLPLTVSVHKLKYKWLSYHHYVSEPVIPNDHIIYLSRSQAQKMVMTQKIRTTRFLSFFLFDFILFLFSEMTLENQIVISRNLITHTHFF